jgi:hypothetical protein
VDPLQQINIMSIYTFHPDERGDTIRNVDGVKGFLIEHNDNVKITGSAVPFKSANGYTPIIHPSQTSPQELPAYVPQYNELREIGYNAAGITPQHLAVALWEAQVEGKFDALSAIQIKRQVIKNKFPKP